uniref:Reverse transcriptase domain-containing protein n=1 Tax=Macrostomum lignano TaxID=282301 RepID=A0A1I8JBM3_9PLAT
MHITQIFGGGRRRGGSGRRGGWQRGSGPRGKSIVCFFCGGRHRVASCNLLEMIGNLEGVEVSGFADDLAAWTCDKDSERAAERIKGVMELVDEWSKKWLLPVAPSKCTLTLFSI